MSDPKTYEITFTERDMLDAAKVIHASGCAHAYRQQKMFVESMIMSRDMSIYLGRIFNRVKAQYPEVIEEIMRLKEDVNEPGK